MIFFPAGLSIAISHFVTVCTILPDKNDCQGNNNPRRIHLELHLPTNTGRKISIHFSELFVFMKLIIHLLKFTSCQLELFPLQFLKIHTIGRSQCVLPYIICKEKQTNFSP